jgi:hypothetical protein
MSPNDRSENTEGRFHVVEPAPPTHPIYSSGYIIGSLGMRLPPKAPRIVIPLCYSYRRRVEPDKESANTETKE